MRLSRRIAGISALVLGLSSAGANAAYAAPVPAAPTSALVSVNRAAAVDPLDGVYTPGEYTLVSHDACGGTDNTRLAGKMDSSPWVQAAGKPNDKADLCASGISAYVDPATGHVMMEGFWARTPDGTGDMSALVALEKNPAPGWDIGDKLVEFDYAASNETITVYTWTWNGTTWVNRTVGQIEYKIGKNTHPDTGGNANANQGTYA